MGMFFFDLKDGNHVYQVEEMTEDRLGTEKMEAMLQIYSMTNAYRKSGILPRLTDRIFLQKCIWLGKQKQRQRLRISLGRPFPIIPGMVLWQRTDTIWKKRR